MGRATYTKLCTEEHLQQINSILSAWHRVEVIPLDKGPKILDTGSFLPGRARDGRAPLVWTEEEKALVLPYQKQLKKLTVQELLDLLAKTPIPSPQSEDYPEGSTLMRLMKTETKDKDGKSRRCVDSILRMRATILLLKAKAAEVSGRKVYY
jgi:hypothetical protein